MFNGRTAAIIRSEAIALIDARGSGIRDDAGEPITDLIDAFSEEAERQEIIASYVESINSIDGWNSIVDDKEFKSELADALGVSATTLNTDLARRLGVPTDLPSDIEAILYLDLNRFAASFGRPRRAAKAATGTERLYLATNNPYTLYRGATVKTGGNKAVLFDTTNDIINVTPAYDTARNKYYVDVGIRCRITGTVGNRIRNTITAQMTTIAGVVAVTNQSATEGGLDRETNEELLEALPGVLGGTDINTTQGLLNFIMSQSGVVDALVVGPGDPLMLRATAGAVDVYVIGSDLITTTIQVKVLGTATPSDPEIFYLPYQPARQINSAVGVNVYAEGGGYQFNSDTGLFAGSAQAVNALAWEPVPAGPSAEELVTVSFTYNSLIRDTQLLLDSDPEREVPGSSILLKEGLLLNVIFQMTIVILPGFTQQQVEQEALTALTNFMTLQKLGQLVEFSTAAAIVSDLTIDGVAAVDRVDNFRMALLGSALSTDNITVLGNQYARLWDVTFIAPNP